MENLDQFLSNIDESQNIFMEEKRDLEYGEQPFSIPILKRHPGKYDYPACVYFLLDIKEDNFTSYFGSKEFNKEEFYEFQTKIFGEHFYGTRNDVRWNFYLMVLIENQNNIPVGDIERDNNYARKLVLSRNEAIEFLNKNWILSSKNTAKNTFEDSDPVNDWENKLEKVGLSNCLYKSFQNKGTVHVENYLEGEDFNYDQKEEGPISENKSKQSNPFKHADIIDELQIDDFRSISCFKKGEKLDFRQVNLIYGNNGSGKTSILEGIEYAITDQINRLEKLEDDKYKNSGTTGILFKNKNNILKPGRESSFYKELDEFWYGYSYGAQQILMLNKHFNRHNYFNSRATINFISEEVRKEEGSKQKKGADRYPYEYSQGMSRLIFGQETTNMQNRWERYYEEFQKQKKKLTNKKTKITKEKNDLNEKLSEIKSEKDFNSEKLRELLQEEVYFANEEINKLYKEDKISWCEEIESTLRSLKERLSDIEEFDLSIKPFTLKELKKRKAKLLSEQNQFEEAIDKAFSINEEKKKINKKKTKLKNSKSEWDKFSHILNQEDKVKEFKETKKELDSVEEALELFEWADWNWEKVLQLTKNDYQVDEDKIDDIKTKVENLEESLKNTKSKIDDREKEFESIKRLKSKIIEKGYDYIEKSSTSTCPLCGHEHASNEELLNHVSEAVEEEYEEELEKLLKKKNSKQNELNKKKKSLQQLEEKQEKKDLMEEVKNWLLSEEVKEKLSMDITEDWSFQQVIDAIDKKLESLQKRKNKLNQKMKKFVKNNMNSKMISRAEKFKEGDKFYTLYIDDNEINDFGEFLEKEKEKFDEGIESLKEQIQEIDTVESEDEEIDEILKSQKKKLNEVREKLDIVDNLIGSLNLLQEYFLIEKVEELRSWKKKVDQCRSRATEGKKKLTRLSEQQKLEEKITEIEKEKLPELNNKIERAENALNCFDKLKKIQEVTKSFVKENFERIKKIFKFIHLPREFEDIEWDEKKETIKIHRKGSEHDPLLPYQMSTGQRTSLALSVMFTLHMLAENAPDFLMLDEPVANMDDLHFLNLMDLLRDLALEGKQIIFTTANEEIANLFRRKFSFLEEDFVRFNLDRYKNEPAEIERLTYVPNKEEPERLTK